MARPKGFNRQEALDKAMELFWGRGYEATTMTELRHAMGIGRQSLYDTFGDKEQLFAEVLEQYVRFNDNDVAKCLNAERGLDGIRDFFHKRVEMLSSGARRGCLMINTCVELSPHEPAVAAQVHRGLESMRRGFEMSLTGMSERGELLDTLDVSSVAAFMTTQVAGMVVMAKNNAEPAQLRAAVDLALSALS